MTTAQSGLSICISLGQLQSLIQLSIGLNAAYFSLRTPNQSIYEKVIQRKSELSLLCTNSSISSENVEHRKLSAINDEYVVFGNRVKLIYDLIDKYVFVATYTVCTLYVVLLLLASIYANFKLSLIGTLIIFLIGYFPVGVAVAAEFYIYKVFRNLSHRSEKVLADAKSYIIGSLPNRRR